MCVCVCVCAMTEFMTRAGYSVPVSGLVAIYVDASCVECACVCLCVCERVCVCLQHDMGDTCFDEAATCMSQVASGRVTHVFQKLTLGTLLDWAHTVPAHSVLQVYCRRENMEQSLALVNASRPEHYCF